MRHSLERCEEITVENVKLRWLGTCLHDFITAPVSDEILLRWLDKLTPVLHT